MSAKIIPFIKKQNSSENDQSLDTIEKVQNLALVLIQKAESLESSTQNLEIPVDPILISKLKQLGMEVDKIQKEIESKVFKKVG